MPDTRGQSDYARQLVEDSERDRKRYGDVTYHHDVFVHVPTGPRPTLTGNPEGNPIWEVRGPQYHESYVTMPRLRGHPSPFRRDTLLGLRTKFLDCVEHLASGGRDLPSVLDPEVTQTNISEENEEFLKNQMAVCDDWKTRLNVNSSYEEYKAYDEELNQAFQKYITKCSELIVENHPLREQIKSNVKTWDQLGEDDKRMRNWPIVGQLIEESQAGDNLADKDLKRRLENVSKPSLWVVLGHTWAELRANTVDTREPDLVPDLCTYLHIPLYPSNDRTKSERVSAAQEAFRKRLKSQSKDLYFRAEDRPESASGFNNELSELWDEPSRTKFVNSQYIKINATDKEFSTRLDRFLSTIRNPEDEELFKVCTLSGREYFQSERDLALFRGYVNWRNLPRDLRVVVDELATRRMIDQSGAGRLPENFRQNLSADEQQDIGEFLSFHHGHLSSSDPYSDPTET
ncbi:hypothetical protein I302_100931 [Kwoniella bestiolae CBS 10118]|uniref:Uncharacterized protein n=1 Tax=Kwoniella bestiolae CBS 10118 TaxID=1296100 RepID=A0A1B9G6J3_9TREE|nr:hypothetical protein I302_04307 [Kwoniella bestiolae CBS 10118]OCF26621.1 hypothetical protein I302_04307 [Kwoniella bestiolae CBS 10118]